MKRLARGWGFLVVVALLSGSFGVSSAGATARTLSTTCTIDGTSGLACTAASIQTAIDGTASGATVTIGAGTYTGDIDIDMSKTLESAPGATVTLDGQSQGCEVVEIPLGVVATIEGITITDGSPCGFDGGGISNIGTLTLDESTVTKNQGAGAGGIFNDGALTVVDSSVSDNLNNSHQSGGGITSYPIGGSSAQSVVLTDSKVDDNSGGRGGGLFIWTGTDFTVTGSTIDDNNTNFDNSGGGIYEGGGTSIPTTITNSTIDGNNGELGIGGGIDAGTCACASSLMIITNTTISHNTIGGDGGGIANFSAPMTIKDSTITDNSADGAGGGVFGDGYEGVSTVTATGSTISGNSANNGGGVYDFADATMTAADSVISDNAAKSNATSAGYGGGAFNDGTSNLTLDGTTVAGNDASAGGGIDNGGTLTIESSTLDANTARVGGAGVLDDPDASGTGPLVRRLPRLPRATPKTAQPPAATITNSTLFDNSASAAGAATVGGGVDNEGALTALNDTITDNSATNSGGVFQGQDSTFSVGNTILADNSVTGSDPDVNDASALTESGPDMIGLSFDGVSYTPSEVFATSAGVPDLAANGGPADTIALAPLSPAISTGNAKICEGLIGPTGGSDADERGASRYASIRGDCALGAYDTGYAAITLTKSVSDATPEVGTEDTFTLGIRNAGPSPSGQVVVTDVLPSGLAYDSSAAESGSAGVSGGTVSVSGQTVTWTIPDLPTNVTTGTQSAQLEITVTVKTTSAVTNTATYAAQTPAADGRPTGSSNKVTITPSYADVALGETVSNPQPSLGADDDYAIDLTNKGPGTANGLVVTDPLPASVVFVSATTTTGTATESKVDGTETVTWQAGSLVNGGNASLGVEVRIVAQGEPVDTATLTESSYDPSGQTKKASVSTVTLVPVVIPPTHTGEPWSDWTYWLLTLLLGLAGFTLIGTAGRRRYRASRH